MRSWRAALGIVAVLVAVAVAAPLIAPYNPNAQPDMALQKTLQPSLHHWLGTDPYSRDVLSRMIYGARISLGVAAVSVIVALALGIAVGGAAGLAGGWVDRWLMRLVDGLLSIPRLLVVIVISAAFGQLAFTPLAVVIGLTGWPSMSRLVRAQVRETAALEYVLAARALGVREFRILWRHVLPAVAPQVLVAATLAVASVIPLEAGLSFLGLGVPAPTASWGNIMLDGYQQGLQAWWLVVPPGVAIVLTVLSVNVIGERLHVMLDPRLRPPV